MSDQLDRLTAVRDLIADQIKTADDRTMPALSREYRAVLAAIEALPSEDKKATVDDLRERRAERQAEAKARARTKG